MLKISCKKGFWVFIFFTSSQSLFISISNSWVLPCMIMTWSRGSKSGPHSENSHIWEAYLTVEIVFRQMSKIPLVQQIHFFQHITVSNTLLSSAIYCTKQKQKNKKVQILKFGFCWPLLVASISKVLRDRWNWSTNYQKISSQSIQRTKNAHIWLLLMLIWNNRLKRICF
jgi:hypothetical protein